ncbi:hypothetical protein [Bradyrhizobium archetypum]|uniref:Uncharacterized protein n=1 Tax=Bradyrhizobium archetypum TaxID=2721160 RepID=A0A7Y4M161_9BRAD|nr:hypothetical protein [Bradyrhizobium archetypum]NOJ46034.1 hypothetical protein [Bradyrhizobium archetypum]
MRQQRTQRSPVAAPATTTKAPTDLPTSGYALIVDGHAKREFKTQSSAIQAAKGLKTRFPNLQIKVYDAQAKRAEQIEIDLAPA